MKLSKKSVLLTLWALFLISVSLNLYFSQVRGISLDSYHALVEAKSISQNLLPQQGLSSVPSIFYYLLVPIYNDAFISELISAAFISSIVFVVFYFCRYLTNDNKASLFAAFMTLFIPAFFEKSVAQISQYSLLIPLIFLFFFAFARFDSKNYVYLVVFMSFLLPLISPLSLIIVPVLILYFALSRVLMIPIDKKEAELIFLVTFVVIWAVFVSYKKPIQVYGFNALFQNIPQKIIAEYFSYTSILDAFVKIGIIPIMLGVYTIYSRMFEAKDKFSYLLISFVFVLSFLIWQRLIELEMALILLGISLSILASISLKDLFEFAKKTKLSKVKNYIYPFLIFSLLIISVIPTLSFALSQDRKSSNSDLKEGLLWLKSNSQNDSKIISSPKQGYAIEFISEREVILDNSFILKKDAQSRYEDISKLYQAAFITDALSIMDKYGAKYIILDNATQAEFKIDELRYVDNKCLKEVFSKSDVKIFESTCELK